MSLDAPCPKEIKSHLRRLQTECWKLTKAGTSPDELYAYLMNRLLTRQRRGVDQRSNEMIALRIYIKAQREFCADRYMEEHGWKRHHEACWIRTEKEDV